MRGAVSFVGAGPGAADLITLRGAERIAAADLVLYGAGVVDLVWLRERARADAELVDCSRLGHDEVVELYRRLASRRGRGARLFPGDPALSPELREHRELCVKVGLDVEVVPGVSAVSAAATATGTGLTEHGGAESVVVTTVEADFGRVRDLAATDRTLVVRAPAARAAELVETLVEAGFAEDVPVTVAYKVSRPDETLLRTTVGELAAEVKRHNLWRTALFLIGDALREGRPRPGYTPRPDGELATHRWAARSWRATRAARVEATEDAAAHPDAEPAAKRSWSSRRDAQGEAAPAVEEGDAAEEAVRPEVPVEEEALVRAEEKTDVEEQAGAGEQAPVEEPVVDEGVAPAAEPTWQTRTTEPEPDRSDHPEPVPATQPARPTKQQAKPPVKAVAAKKPTRGSRTTTRRTTKKT